MRAQIGCYANVKRLAIIGIWISASFSFGAQFSYQNMTFNVDKKGDQYLIFPASFAAVLIDTSEFSKNDCLKLDQEISKQQEGYDSCDESPESSMCKLLKDSIKFRSREENFHRPAALYPLNRTWNVSLTIPAVDETLVKQYAAAELNFDARNAIVMLKPQIKLTRTPMLEIQEPSLLHRVTRLVPFGPDSLDILHVNHGVLTANNRFLACDLEHHRLKVSAEFLARFSYRESIAAEDLETVWSLYQDLRSLMSSEDFISLSTLIKAGLVGHMIGTRLAASTLHPEKFSLEKLLDGFFVINDWNLVLKSFESKEDLGFVLYPDQIHTKEIQSTWRIE